MSLRDDTTSKFLVYVKKDPLCTHTQACTHTYTQQHYMMINKACKMKLDFFLRPTMKCSTTISRGLMAPLVPFTASRIPCMRKMTLGLNANG